MANIIVLLSKTVSRLEAQFQLLFFFFFSSKSKAMFLNVVTLWQ